MNSKVRLEGDYPVKSVSFKAKLRVSFAMIIGLACLYGEILTSLIHEKRLLVMFSTAQGRALPRRVGLPWCVDRLIKHLESSRSSQSRT